MMLGLAEFRLKASVTVWRTGAAPLPTLVRARLDTRYHPGHRLHPIALKHCREEIRGIYQVL